MISYSDTITQLITLHRHILTSIWKEISVRNYICRELNKCKELNIKFCKFFRRNFKNDF
jgi:hypothetical protein